MKRVLTVAGIALALLMIIPLLMLILVIGSSSSVAACQSWADNQPLPGLPNTQVTIAQANIKVSLPRAAFEADLSKVLATSPDFVSLNEVSRRPDAQITPAGYGMWRDPRHGADGTAVLWRADKWTKVASGRVMIVTSGPQRWDHSRAATWATLQGSDGSNVSMISVHHMINPKRYGPNKPLRRQLYRQGMEKVQRLVEDLSADGPVFLAGDLNYQYADNDSWGPRAMLGTVGMKSSMDVLGRAATHDGGGIIDYQFFQTDKAVPTIQNTTDLASDHHLLTATYSLLGTGSATGPVGPVAGLTAKQTANAAQVFTTGRQMGMGQRGIVIALAVASQESSFKIYANDGRGNDLAPDQRGIEASLALPHDAVGSDHGSLGIMQQQWPWWSPVMEQLMDPASASRLFYDALRNVRGWERMEITEAAQAVQRSAYPEAYADDVPLAQRLYDHFAAGGTTPGDEGPVEPIGLTPEEQEDCRDLLGLPETMSCPPTGLPVEQGLTPDALLVLRCVDQQFGRHVYGGVGDRPANPGSDHPSGRAVDVMIENYSSSPAITEGDQIAEWVRAHAVELGVKYVIWRAKIWNLGDSGWSTYTHPSGATDDTNLHFDHVHVSVFGNRGTGFPGGGGAVVYPVPASMRDTNRDNWGASGGSWDSWHTGTDFSVPCGTPVLASHSGTVKLEHDQAWAGHTLVKVAVAPGQLTTWYAHMESVSVSNGQMVAAGQQLGTAGREGNSRGCHLHFEVHLQGGSIYGSDNTDPTPWLAANVGTTLGGGMTRVATFNVLGHTHTQPGRSRAGWPDSHTRMQGAVGAINAAGIEIAGLQEFQRVQSRTFLRLTNGTWDVYPRPGGVETANTVAWRTDRWALVRAEWIQIPYFGGREKRMPYVLLRNLATGQQVWVASFHNPANVFGPAQRWRDEAERRQAALATSLHRTGVPVIITGDMNDRADYFCDTVENSPLHAANGGSARPCRPPANMAIDWIMGTPPVTFSAYRSDHSVRQAWISDHPLISATVTFN